MPGNGIEGAVHCVINKLSDRMEDKAKPAIGIVIGLGSGHGIGIDKRGTVHRAIYAERGIVVLILRDHLVRAGAAGGQSQS